MVRDSLRRRPAVGSRAPAKLLIAIFLAAALSACAVADQLSGHSIEYNIQASDTKNQTLLINILRAAYRRPLQFTDLSTISGQLSVSGTAAFSVPFGGLREGSSRIDQFNPSVTVSNSPTYTVSVLNTKEFYQGILTPIPMKTLSYYINIGFPEYVLLTLVVSEIDYGPPNARRRIVNIPDRKIADSKAGKQFADLLRLLIDMGLTVEDVEETVPIGAPFEANKYPSPTDLVALDAKNIRVADLGNSHFQLKKTNQTSRFCFDPGRAHNIRVYAGAPVGDTGEKLPASLICGARRNSALVPAMAANARASRHAAIKPAPEQADPQTSEGYEGPLVIRTHSTEGIIYYLGEIARIQLGLVPPTSNNWDPGIFHLKQGTGGPNTIDAAFEGKPYYIDADPTGEDRSSQVLDLVTELLAQNNSAKDLPAPNIIPIAR
jgi:hypothetical protein